MMMYRWTILLFVVGTALTGSAYAGSPDFIPGISGDIIPGDLAEPDTILTDSEINTSKLYSPEVNPLDLS